MISRDCADPGLAMAWLDALYDPEVLLRASFGEKDVDWRTPPEGTVAVDGGPAKVEILRDRWTNPVTGFWGESFPLRFQGNNIARMLLPADDNPELVTEYQAARMYEPYIEPCALLPFAYDRDTQIQVNEWRTNIGDYARGMITAFIFGHMDIDDDTHWDTYVSEIQEYGLDSYLSALQTAFDRNWRDVYPAAYTPLPQRTE